MGMEGREAATAAEAFAKGGGEEAEGYRTPEHPSAGRMERLCQKMIQSFFYVGMGL